MRQLLQIATVFLQNAAVITKSDVYNKLRHSTQYFVFGIIKFKDSRFHVMPEAVAQSGSLKKDPLKIFEKISCRSIFLNPLSASFAKWSHCV